MCSTVVISPPPEKQKLISCSQPNRTLLSTCCLPVYRTLALRRETPLPLSVSYCTVLYCSANPTLSFPIAHLPPNYPTFSTRFPYLSISSPQNPRSTSPPRLSPPPSPLIAQPPRPLSLSLPLPLLPLRPLPSVSLLYLTSYYCPSRPVLILVTSSCLRCHGKLWRRPTAAPPYR